MESEYENKFYTMNKGKNFIYCAQDENIYFQGTRDSGVYKKIDAFLIWDVKRCSTELGDVGCATETEINNWVYHKKIQMRVINNKIDFKSWGAFNVR